MTFDFYRGTILFAPPLDMALGWSVLIISEKIIVIRIKYDKNGCSSLKMLLF